MQEKLKDKYIDPFTDFGFKKLFGEECNKDLLLDFLNELLHKEEGKIVSLSYLKNEMLGVSEEARKAVFDIHCENEKGEKFIVEIQKSKQAFFKDRTLYYSTFPITRQAIPGDWNFELKAVYTVAILNFVFEDGKNDPDEYLAYIDSLNSYRDLKNCMDTAEEEGRVKGKTEEKIEIAKNAKVLGLSIKQIQKLTNLTKEEIDKI